MLTIYVFFIEKTFKFNTIHQYFLFLAQKLSLKSDPNEYTKDLKS